MPQSQEESKAGGQKICDGSRIKDTVDAKETGQDQDQRQQENDLSGQRDEDSINRFSNGGEKVSGYRLDSIQDDEKQEDPEITAGESEIFLAYGAKDSCDLSGKQLE